MDFILIKIYKIPFFTIFYSKKRDINLIFILKVSGFNKNLGFVLFLKNKVNGVFIVYKYIKYIFIKGKQFNIILIIYDIILNGELYALKGARTVRERIFN